VLIHSFGKFKIS